MDTQYQNKGFTLLDCLLIMFIISMISVISISHIKVLEFNEKYFISDYLTKQVDSLINKQTTYYVNKYSKYPIYFNEKGNVNMAQTVYVDNHKIIIFLGSGCLRYE